MNWVFLAYFEEILFASNPGRAFNTFFKPNGFCENLLTRTFGIKKRQAHVVGGGGIFPINSAQCLVKKSSDPCHAPLELKRSVEMRAQKTGGKRSICEK